MQNSECRDQNAEWRMGREEPPRTAGNRMIRKSEGKVQNAKLRKEVFHA